MLLGSLRTTVILNEVEVAIVRCCVDELGGRRIRVLVDLGCCAPFCFVCFYSIRGTSSCTTCSRRGGSIFSRSRDAAKWLVRMFCREHVIAALSTSLLLAMWGATCCSICAFVAFAAVGRMARGSKCCRSIISRPVVG